MDIKWTDDGDGTLSAGVGSVILLVTPHDGGGVWNAEIKIKYGIVDEATFACREDAVRWCGRRLPDIVDPIVATARAEGELAEREHIASSLEAAAPFWDPDGANALLSMARDIRTHGRARTTPATLSTETLAAIAEARGLRVVEPELLAGLVWTELATAERERDEARAELATLTARVEAVRARAIEECADLAETRKRYALAGQIRALAGQIRALAAQRPTPEKCPTCNGDGLDPETTCGDDVNDLDDDTLTCGDCGGSGLARGTGMQPAPSEPADVDPAAGALR